LFQSNRVFGRFAPFFFISSYQGEYTVFSMEVKAIREEDSNGRHTTTHRQMVKLPGGAFIIDTPGMRELGLWDADEGVSALFCDIEALALQCRFSDCPHGNESGCAVRAALDDGSLSEEQWKHYLTHKKESAFVESRAAFLQHKKHRVLM
jgi:ribosome biogenesis GTPase